MLQDSAIASEVVTAGIHPRLAQEQAPSGQPASWQFTASAYLWLASKRGVIELENVLRDDVVRPGLTVEAALANAPDRSGDHFLVPAVLGDESDD